MDLFTWRLIGLSASALLALAGILLLRSYMKNEKRWQDWGRSAPPLDRKAHTFKKPPPPSSGGKFALGSALLGIAIAVAAVALTYTPQDR